METMPQVEPPADGAWEVLCRLHQVQAEQWEQERRRAPGFLEWLRGLSPANAAMGGALATLVIAGTVWYTANPRHTQNTVLPGIGRSAPPPVAPHPASDAPTVLAAYGPLTTAGQQVTLQ